jgi:hypothetical protein
VKEFLTFIYRNILGIIRIPSIQNLIHLTNDSVHCIEYRQLDTTAILTM